MTLRSHDCLLCCVSISLNSVLSFSTLQQVEGTVKNFFKKFSTVALSLPRHLVGHEGIEPSQSGRVKPVPFHLANDP
jgi:hypothetical protein